MTEYVMRITGLAGHYYGGESAELPDPAYLETYDLEYGGGRGSALVTGDRRDAMRFADIAALFETWRASPQSRPLRDDGKPNRPLTAYTITPESVHTCPLCDGEGDLIYTVGGEPDSRMCHLCGGDGDVDDATLAEWKRWLAEQGARP